MMEEIKNSVRKGLRLSEEEVLFLYENAPLTLAGQLANEARCRMHPDNQVTYVIDRNINYTNICISGCKFCAYYCAPEDKAGYVLSKEKLGKKLEETLELGGTQVLLQGGLHPDLGFDFYEDMLSFIKGYGLHCHAFSAPEIVHFSKISGLDVEQVLKKLIAAGLDSIPGGGAEILVDRVREKIAPRKATVKEWLHVMETAHGLGLKTTATMMFGHIETFSERV